MSTKIAMDALKQLDLVTQAAEQLLADIDSMFVQGSDYDYGGFSEMCIEDDGYYIQWPNLVISASKLRRVLNGDTP